MLNVINFLPGDYQERRSRRRANIACLIIGGVSVLGIGVVVGLTFISMLGMAAMRAVVDQQYREASRQIDQLKQLEERKANLVHKVDLSTALLERVPRSHLLARLTNYLPPKTAMMGLALRGEEVEVPANSAEALAAGVSAQATAEEGASTQKPAAAGPTGPAQKAASGKRSSSKKSKPEMVKVKRWTFRLDGLAPTDVEVAEFIGRLTQDPLFRDVDLMFSEEFPYKEGVTMRKFQLLFRLGLDAEKVLSAAAPAAMVVSPAPAAPAARAEAPAPADEPSGHGAPAVPGVPVVTGHGLRAKGDL